MPAPSTQSSTIGWDDEKLTQINTINTKKKLLTKSVVATLTSNLKKTNLSGYNYGFVTKHRETGDYYISTRTNMPCLGEFAWYKANHGEKWGYPNHYRPNDLWYPFPDPELHKPVAAFCRIKSLSLEKLVELLTSNLQNNIWKAGLDRPKVTHIDSKSLIFYSRANMNITVFVNMCKNWQIGYVDTPCMHDPSESRIKNGDPRLYFADKTWAEGGNYYRGGMNRIWKEGPIEETLNTES